MRRISPRLAAASAAGLALACVVEVAPRAPALLASAPPHAVCVAVTEGEPPSRRRQALLMAALTRQEQREQADQELRVLEAVGAPPTDPGVVGARRRYERATRELREICDCLGPHRSELGEACEAD